jgi:hypothetical protein
VSRYFNRQGRPMSFEQWCERPRTDHRVAETTLPSGYWVSTVHLGLDHQFGEGPPLIFETMVFPCDADGKPTSWCELDSDRYSTEEEALAGHASICGEWRDREAQS